MAVQGNLRDMSLVSLISINCNEMNQARLLIKHQEQEAALFFQDGNVVHMTLGSQEGEEVIHKLLTWEEGEFELEQGVPPPKRTVTTGWSGLLLEGMRQVDESAAGWEVEWDEVEAEEPEKTGDEEATGWEAAWDEVEAEEPKKTRGDTAERLARDLKRITGVEGALVCSGEGQVLGQDTNANPVKEAALTAFVGQRAEDLGAFLTAGQLKQVVLAGEKRRAMIVTHEQNYVGLSLTQRTFGSVAQVIQTTLRRYR